MSNETLDLVTPEQRTAIELAREESLKIEEIFKEVAASILQTVPDASDKPVWKHGSCRIVARIGKCDVWSIENGTAPSDIDLSEIDYIVFYRQAVRNKHTGEVKGFASWVPCGSPREIIPGETIEVKEVIGPDWSREDLESKARESFLKLQEMCEEFYNREDGR